MNKKSLSKSSGWVIPSGQKSKVQQNGKAVIAAPVNLRLSLNQMMTLRWSLLEELLLLRASQYDAIGLWRPKVSEVGEELCADLIRESGLSVSSLSFVGGFTGVNGLGYEESLADARDAINDADLLGAENVIAVSGSRNGHTTRHSRRLVVDALTELADLSGERGIKLLVLPMHSFFSPTWTFLNTLDETVELISQINHTSVGLAFDTYQLWHEPRLMDWIPDVAPITGIVQVSDARRPPQSAAERCNPGEGLIPLGEIVRAFHRSGYDGYYDIQVWSSDGWSADYTATVARCREKMLQFADGSPALRRP